MYADVGSLALQLQPRVVNMTVDDSNRVEYAQIKIQSPPSLNKPILSEELDENHCISRGM